MYIFSVEEAQNDLPRILDMVAQGKDVAIGGERPALLLKVRNVGNIVDKHGNEAGGSIIIMDVDKEVLEDELVKPVPDDIIESFYGPIFPDEPDQPRVDDARAA
ncbi:hypothetical protein QCE62_28050 [Caballeronia sp. LZ033]|uniref:hypothetical protein n=1 Tax=Caballeronia sp. LZ033 TaxID=3038566 RepID=UPI002866790A|nr:hypothetical protein [Caballeronia sp. LZ033]MDR5817463.1 hypothetical protein [Caballeronia sp. LZ033]